MTFEPLIRGSAELKLNESAHQGETVGETTGGGGVRVGDALVSQHARVGAAKWT